MNTQFSPKGLSRSELEIEPVMLVTIDSPFHMPYGISALWLKWPFMWMEKLRLMEVYNLRKPWSWQLSEADTNHRVLQRIELSLQLCPSPDASVHPAGLK